MSEAIQPRQSGNSGLLRIDVLKNHILTRSNSIGVIFEIELSSSELRGCEWVGLIILLDRDRLGVIQRASGTLEGDWNSVAPAMSFDFLTSDKCARGSASRTGEKGNLIPTLPRIRPLRCGLAM